MAFFAASVVVLMSTAIYTLRLVGNSDSFRLANAVLTPSAVATASLPADVFLRPVRGEPTSAFGPRCGRMHNGVDLLANVGDPIHASRAGRIMAEPCGSGYGMCTIIDHGNGLTTLYAHMSAKVVEGGRVERGQVIGLVGCTGHCHAPHLHFELRENGIHLSPLERVSP